MHYALQKCLLEPHRGEITQPWVERSETHGTVSNHTEPRRGEITQPWVERSETHGTVTNHTEPRSGDITQPWVTTHGMGVNPRNG